MMGCIIKPVQNTMKRNMPAFLNEKQLFLQCVTDSKDTHIIVITSKVIQINK